MKNKVFVIGYNKTGTTTMEAVLKSLGYKMHHQDKSAKFLKDWVVRDFSNIIDLCKSADAFQDFPFSLDDTYIAMDKAFPDSKFILTIRKDKEEWYNSWIRFIKILFSKNDLPTAEDIKNVNLSYKEAAWVFWQAMYGVNEDAPFDYELMTDRYERHNKSVIEYFKDRPQDLLVVNVANSDAIKRIYTFLGHDYNGEKMPHLNTSNKK